MRLGEKQRRVAIGVLTAAVVLGFVGLAARALAVRAPEGEPVQSVQGDGISLELPAGAQVKAGDGALEVTWCRAPRPEDPDCYFLFGPNRLSLRRLPDGADPAMRWRDGPIVETEITEAAARGPGLLVAAAEAREWGLAPKAHAWTDRWPKYRDGFLEGTFELDGARYRVECYQGQQAEEPEGLGEAWCLPYLATIRPTR